MLRLLYALPLRPIELIRLKTHDIANDLGHVLPKRDRVMRKEVSFNGRERPMPIVDDLLIESLERWVYFRFENGWGVTRTGNIDPEASFFLMNKADGFKIRTTNSDDVIRHNADSINRIIRQRMKDNQLTGSVDSTLRTWTLDRHRGGFDVRLIWAYRGDNDIESVKRVVRGDPIRLGALVEKVY